MVWGALCIFRLGADPGDMVGLFIILETYEDMEDDEVEDGQYPLNTPPALERFGGARMGFLGPLIWVCTARYFIAIHVVV